MVQEMPVDIVIMDVTMPGLGGVEATRQIVQAVPGVKVIALSMYADKRFVMGMLKAGACGYLLKDCAFEELTQAIRAVAANGSYLSTGIVNVVVKDLVQTAGKSEESLISGLTGREREVLQFLVQGNTTKEISNRLDLSVKTIETYRQQIMDKLDIHSIAELTKYAIREGLTSVDS
jgi:DNA-binding NarL/FixJ family response regulator